MSQYLALKQEIHQHCKDLINERIETSKIGIAELQEFLNDDSKSSAGDKHETSRAMAHLEMDKRQQALHHLIQMHNVLQQLDPAKATNKIEPGALVVTSSVIFYIAVSLGKLDMKQLSVLAISYQAPIVAALEKTAKGGTAVFNQQQYKILDIL